MPTIGLAVITNNEERNIAKCIKSVPFSVDTVIVDSCSSDSTVKIAESCGARVFVREWPGYPKQKQFALEQVNADWVLVLDADEYLLPEIQQEVVELVNGNPECSVYRIYGHNLFLGRVLKHGRGVDNSIRLVNKVKARWDEREVHEDIVVDDNLIGQCKNPYIHLSAPTLKERIFKTIKYAELDVEYYRPNTITKNMIFLYPIRYFFGYLIRYSAWKDGLPGIIWLIMQSFQIFYQNALFYEQDQLREKTET